MLKSAEATNANVIPSGDSQGDKGENEVVSGGRAAKLHWQVRRIDLLRVVNSPNLVIASFEPYTLCTTVTSWGCWNAPFIDAVAVPGPNTGGRLP